VKDLRVTSDTPALLNQAAMDAVRQWQYEPFVKDGKAVPVAFTVTVTFALN
jgi:protein TonB